MKKTLTYMLLLSAVFTPKAWADNIADCEVLIAERVEDEGTGGSALISSYRPAGAFLSSVYDDEAGHIAEIDGHKVRAVFCQRRSAIPTLRDFPILETGVALSLSQNFDSASSDLTLTRFLDGTFQATYSGPGLEPQEQLKLDDILEVFNFQPHDLAAPGADEPVADMPEDVGAKSDTDRSDKDTPDKEALKPDTDAPDTDTSSINALDDVVAKLEADEMGDIGETDVVFAEPKIDGPSDDAPTDTASFDAVWRLAGEQSVEQDETSDVLPEDILPDQILPEADVLLADADAPIDDAPIEVEPIAETSDDEAPQANQDIAEASSPQVIVPTQAKAAEFDASCQIITRDAFGTLNKVPFSAAGLQNNLNTAPAFIMPLPAGLKMEAVECMRDTLTPGENDYKVARAGFAFFYIVKAEAGQGQRVAALEFIRGKYRMNLLEGNFTDQELIDAKARILSFNADKMGDENIEGPSE